ncbi:hypothetical protein T265_00114 [Opisthorchis viverrini]|uniref:Uncharacterized protein n=1 Tax=Opisthorchis viverrini TaxID=6198 RepID=A0A075AJZ9_OPIVI|nr:hypothetical protein T265_00114 [Opisthorchis viverrini]KER34264.1 hypothetical protein T265_00114 [Opisthorchis viverrini]
MNSFMSALSVELIQKDARKDQHGSDPLSRGHYMFEQNNGNQHSEELSRCGYDRAHQRPEVSKQCEQKDLGNEQKGEFGHETIG